MTPCPTCGDAKWIGLNQYALLNGPSTYQCHCHSCKLKGPECISQELAEEAWNTDPNGKYQQLSLLA